MAVDKPIHIPFSMVLDKYQTSRSFPIDDAFEMFCDQADLEHRPSSVIGLSDDLGMFFNEWVLFDFPFKKGRTPLECYVASPPKSLAPSIVDRLDQAAKTHLSGSFWLISAEAATHTLLLEECRTGKRYNVIDFAGSSQLDGRIGLIGARIAKVDGVWIFPGNPVSYYPIAPTERMKKAIHEDPSAEPTSFIELVRQRYGREDDKQTKTFLAANPTGMSPREREWQLGICERTIGLMVPKTGVTWEDACRSIRLAHENDEMGPIDAINRVLKPEGGEEVSFDTEEELSAFAEAFCNAWNLMLGSE